MSEARASARARSATWLSLTVGLLTRSNWPNEEISNPCIDHHRARFVPGAQEPGVNPKPNPRAVTAAQINGLYRYDRNEFRILALGQNKLKVQFNGEWMTRGGYPNIGEAIGEATIEGNIATFVPGDTTACKITMTFLKNKMRVEQEGRDADCGFGHNVVASGTYRRVKAGKPKFIPIPH